jgi:hypothetical protein
MIYQLQAVLKIERFINHSLGFGFSIRIGNLFNNHDL